MVSEENIDQFCLITGSERELAKNLLEACGDNIEMAVNMHMENGEGDVGGGGGVQGVGGPPGPVAGPSLDPDEDPVRAPIPQRQETLVQPGFEGYQMNNRINRNHRVSRVRSVFDGFRNFEAETLRRESEEGAGEEEAVPPGYNRNKKKTLEELFKPPLDIMFQGDWQSARDRATSTGRWLLVNIQEPKEFQCQVLNRDLWSNPGVKTIISEHFVFWQQYKESDEAQRYMTFYKITDWPYIAVIDPRTGENMATWSHIDSSGFPELMTEFLTLHPSLDTPEKPPPRKRMRVDNVAEMDEESQLAAAIQASLAETLADKTQDEEEDLCLQTSDDETESPLSKPSSAISKPSSQISKSSVETSKRTHDSGEIKPNGEHLSNGSSGSSSFSNGSSSNGVCGDESWEQYLGPKEDPLTNILIRYPDGSRDPWNHPATSKLKALVQFVSWKGYDLTDHEIVTNFPRRLISQLDQEKTLKEHNLFPRETVFVQLKD